MLFIFLLYFICCACTGGARFGWRSAQTAPAAGASQVERLQIMLAASLCAEGFVVYLSVGAPAFEPIAVLGGVLVRLLRCAVM